MIGYPGSAGVARFGQQMARWLPRWARRRILKLYWHLYDARDFVMEMAGILPSHVLRLAVFRLLGVKVGKKTSIHRKVRVYRPSKVSIGSNTVVNRSVLLDGRLGLYIGDNVSISEEASILTLEHDPNSPTFDTRGGSVRVEARVFVGARAMILPGVTVGEGAVVAAGSVVTRDVPPFAIVAGVPAGKIGERRRDLSYVLEYAKFLG